MHMEHELTLDDILWSADTLGVLDDGLAGGVIDIDEIGAVGAGLLNETALPVLGGDEPERYLLTKVGDKPGGLHDAKLGGTVVLFLGRMGTGGLIAVLIPALDGIG